MVDGVHIAVLIRRLEATISQGFRATPDTARIIAHALRFYLKHRGWTELPPVNRAPPAAHRPRPGPPPTIGQMKKQGVTSFMAICRGIGCKHEKMFTFDELDLPDDQIFVHIPPARRFRCTKCGGRVLRVWPIETKKGPGPAMTGDHPESTYSIHNPNRVPPPPPPRRHP